jgi:hypothetical protein
VSKAIILVLGLIGAATVVVGFIQARSTPTSEGAGDAAALIATGAVAFLVAGATLLVLRRRRGA